MAYYDRKHLNLLREIVVTQFQLKDQSTVLGILWSLLNPLLMLSVLFVVFSYRIGREIDHFAVYLLIGIVHFTHFANSTGSAMHVLYNMWQLTSDTVFPKELLVFGTILSRTGEFAVSLGICLVIAWCSGVALSAKVVLLPIVFLLQLLFVSWVSLFLSFIYLWVRDIDHIYQVFLRILFFVTPIFYPVSYIEGALGQSAVLFNPLTQLVIFSRATILGGEMPSLGLMLGYFVANLVLLGVALSSFKKMEPTFAEAL